MVERYIFIRLKPEHARDRALVVTEARQALAQVPRLVAFSVGTPADDHAAAAWDVSIRMRFESIYDVEPCRVHPAYRRFADELLKPRLDVVKAWSFDVP